MNTNEHPRFPLTDRVVVYKKPKQSILSSELVGTMRLTEAIANNLVNSEYSIWVLLKEEEQWIIPGDLVKRDNFGIFRVYK